MRISIYLINENRDIEEYIKNTEEYKLYKLNIDMEGIEGFLIYQERKNELDWIRKINESGWLQNNKLDQNKIIQRGFLLFKISSDVILVEEPGIFLISFNGGIHLIESRYIDYNFGYDLASKLVSRGKVKSYGSTDIYENIIRTDKNSSGYMPKHLIGENLALSAIESITGYSDSEEFISGNKGVVLNYSGEFNNDLLKILEYLYLEYKYTENDDIYNRLKKVKNINDINKLNKQMCEEIISIKDKFISRGRELKLSDLRSINLSVNFDENVIGYKYTGLNRSKKTYSELDKIEYFEQLSNYIDKEQINSKKLLEKIKRDKIIVIKESVGITEEVEYNIYNSLVYRVKRIDGKSEKVGMLISGSWYYVNSDYYSELNERLESKVVRSDSELDKFSFIDFDKKIYKDELEYNKELARINNGVLLDEKYYYMKEDIAERKYNSRSNIEPCDVLLYSEEKKKYYFIHNKINSPNNTQGISHLSTQANISTSLLLDIETSENFIKFINEKIKEQNCLSVPELKEIRNDNICVVLAIIDKDYDKSLKTNFTILKLQALDNSIARLEQLGVEVKIKLIKNKGN